MFGMEIIDVFAMFSVKVPPHQHRIAFETAAENKLGPRQIAGGHSVRFKLELDVNVLSLGKG